MAGGKNKKKLLKKLKYLAGKMVKLVPVSPKERRESINVDVFLLRDAEIKAIKKRFLPREEGPANVLSFAEPLDWPNPQKGARNIGEVYLNLDLTDGKMENLTPLLLHGVLHLFGYDHKKKSATIKMERMEKRIIGKLK